MIVKNDNDLRMKALQKLGIWFIFFVVLFGFIFISNFFNKANESDEKKEEEVTDNDYEKSLANLSNNHYFLKAVIDNNGVINYFEGERKDGILEGYWQDNETIIKCQMVDNRCADYDAYFLNINNILDLLNTDTTGAMVTEVENKITYDFADLNGVSLLFEAYQNNIELIKIKNDTITYEINLVYVQE